MALNCPRGTVSFSVKHDVMLMTMFSLLVVMPLLGNDRQDRLCIFFFLSVD